MLSAATGGTNRSTVPARPQSTRAPGGRGDRAADRQLGVVPVDGDAAGLRSAPIIRSVSRLRSAPLMVDVPCAVASAASTSARLVCDFEPGTVTVACTGLGVVGACQPPLCSSRPRVLTVSILPCRPFRATMGHMCGRFAVTTDPALLAEKIQAIDEARRRARASDASGPNYNVAPTTTISTVVKRHTRTRRRVDTAGAADALGLVPPWAKDGGGRAHRTPRAHC